MSTILNFFKFVCAIAIAFVVSQSIRLLYEWVFVVFALCLKHIGILTIGYLLLTVILIKLVMSRITLLVMIPLARLTSNANKLVLALLTLIFVYGIITAVVNQFFYPDVDIIAQIGKGFWYYIGAICTLVLILINYIICLFIMWDKPTKDTANELLDNTVL